MNQLLIKDPQELAETLKHIVNNNNNKYTYFYETDTRKTFILSEEDLTILMDAIDNHLKDYTNLTEEICSFYIEGEPAKYLNPVLWHKEGKLVVDCSDYDSNNYVIPYNDFLKRIEGEQWLVISERSDVTREWFKKIIK